MIRITAKKDGFRRCGVAHSTTATVHPRVKFSEEQIQIMQRDPLLVVELLDPEGAPADTKGKGKKG